MQNWFKSIVKKFNNKGRNQKRYFYRLIWIGCMSACIPVILIGALYYYFATNSLTEQIRDDSRASVVLFKERVERILQSIELESHQLASIPLIRDSFTTDDFNQKITTHLEILRQLKITKLENSFIKEVYYFHAEDNFVLSNEYGFISNDSFKYKEDINNIMEKNQSVAWLHLPIASKKGYIALARKLPILKSGEPKGFLVILVNKELFLDYYPSNDYQSSFILDQQNNVLFEDQHEVRLIKDQHVNALNKVVEQRSSSGSFYEMDQNKDKTLYIYDGKSTLGRVYISLIPKSAISKELSLFRWLILSSVIIILCIGILLTIFNTRRAYSPIKQLITYSKSLSIIENTSDDNKNEISIIKDSLQNLSLEKQRLRSYKEEIEPKLKEWFFQQVLEGNYVYDQFFYKKCKDYNIQINGQYVVIVISAANDETENKIIDFLEFKNMMVKLLQDDPTFEGMAFNHIQNNLSVLFRTRPACSSEQIKAKLYEISINIYNTAQESFSSTISIGVGRVYQNITDITNSYEEAVHALRYRIYKDPDTVLFFEDLVHSRSRGMFFYPREQELRIIESLKVGDLEQATLAFHDFSKTISSFESYNSIYQCFHLFLSSIIFNLEKQGNSIMEIFEPDLFGQLKSLQTLDEVNKWFTKYLFPLFKSLSNESESSSGTIAVKQICQYINENIASDITLTQCAEMVDLTPSYLSRLFKKEVGMNFREYVLIRKVEKAKSLCVQTDARISEIAEAVGYSERNLTRLFQRYVDMTLSQYRNKNR